jgi:hypothetical protein
MDDENMWFISSVSRLFPLIYITRAYIVTFLASKPLFLTIYL